MVTGMVAILALSIHSFFDGVAIGAVTGGLFDAGQGGDSHGHATQPLAFAVFLSVLIHKPMDGLTLSVLLINANTPMRRMWFIQIFYAALVPVGALAFMATRGAVAEPSTLVGYTLAFSAGTFLAIALTDLLPELHFHAHDRHKLSFALLFGLLVMWLTSLIGHGESSSDHEHAHAADCGATSTSAAAGLFRQADQPNRPTTATNQMNMATTKVAVGLSDNTSSARLSAPSQNGLA